MCFGNNSGPQERPQPARPAAKPPRTQAGSRPRTHRSVLMQTMLPAISLQQMNVQTITEACRATGQALSNEPYALIGGAACSLLGSRRGTYDIDIVVLDGRKRAVVSQLDNLPEFGVERGSMRTWYNASNGNHYNLDVMEPSTIHQQFTGSTETINVQGITVLKPVNILNFKCFSYVDRSRPAQKKQNDGRDIRFLLDYMIQHGERVHNGQLRFADEDFLVDYISSYPDTKDKWVQIGARRPSR